MLYLNRRVEMLPNNIPFLSPFPQSLLSHHYLLLQSQNVEDQNFSLFPVFGSLRLSVTLNLYYSPSNGRLQEFSFCQTTIETELGHFT